MMGASGLFSPPIVQHQIDHHATRRIPATTLSTLSDLYQAANSV